MLLRFRTQIIVPRFSSEYRLQAEVFLGWDIPPEGGTPNFTPRRKFVDSQTTAHLEFNR
jgi:hypothetical protein